MSTVSTVSAQTILDTIFADVQGYSLSSAGRTRIGHESDPSFTYGEVTPDAMQAIFDVVQPKEGEVFYDLGSGTGKAVMLAALLAPFAKSVGVEILDELRNSAETSRLRYESEVKPTLPAEKQAQQIEFRLADIFMTDITDADVVFSHCTCFDDALMQRLTEHCEKLKPGARVVTITKGITSPQFETVASFTVHMAWGDATACIYKKI